MLYHYTATKKPSTVNGVMYLYIPQEWGFHAGELVRVSMTQDESVMCIRKDCILKGSGRKAKILVEKTWGFDPKMLVRFTICRL